MDKLTLSRKKIDKLDKKIMSSLNKRFTLSNEIGILKNTVNLPVVDEIREKEILDKVNNYENASFIEPIYQKIFDQSKDLQAKYYLALKNGKYSYSKDYHERLGNHSYNVYETETLLPLLINQKPLGVNVSNPLKAQALKLCSDLTKEARNTGIVNLMTRKGHAYIGDNTDPLAFQRLIEYYKIDVKNKNIIIIGNGATSISVSYCLKRLGVKSIVKLVRTKKNDNEILIEEMPYNLSADLLINCTSFDVYPNFTKDAIIDINKILDLTTFIDVNYNPNRSSLYLACEKRGLKCYNGLMMLIQNALISEELWQNKDFLPIIPKVILKDQLEKLNIVLIGQTLSGKTTIGEGLSFILNKKHLDTDEIIFKANEYNLPDNHDLELFREKETEVITNISKEHNSIISIGAGAILNEQNIHYLKKNGVVVFLDLSLDELKERFKENARPLLKSVSDLDEMYHQRQKLYLDSCDLRVTIAKNESISDIIEKILEKIHEYFNHQWL